MSHRLIYTVKQLEEGVGRLSYPQSSSMAMNPWLTASNLHSLRTGSAGWLEDPQVGSEFVPFQLCALWHWIMCTASESIEVRMFLLFCYVL